jgi:chromosome segregation ATPase
MMKEVESGRKLRKVQCNDRSNPIINCKSVTKIKGQFIFETEKDAAHNKLLNEIQGGVKLRPTATNDRSKPILAGLRKFRRQMTVEEQLKKSESKLNVMAAEAAATEDTEDELDDIDNLRDDLQSTKQMLALELRNKEAQERENKRLAAKIANLEAELERAKAKGGPPNGESAAAADDALVESLKKEAEEAQKTSKALEKKFEAVAEDLDAAKNELEEKKRQIAALEKRLSGQVSLGGFRRAFALTLKRTN